MLKRKILCCVLHVFILLHKVDLNSAEVLRMDWMRTSNRCEGPGPRPKTNTDDLAEFMKLTQEAILSLGVFKHVEPAKISILEYARAKLENSFVLVLCKISNSESQNYSGTVFYGAITHTSDGSHRKVVAHSIGFKLDVAKVEAQVGNTAPLNKPKPVSPRGARVDPGQMKVKYAAEFYALRHHAFQPTWQPSESYEHNVGHLKFFDPSGITGIKNYIDHYGLNFFKYWIVQPRKEMVILYSNTNGSTGAYATITINTTTEIFRLINFEISSPFEKTFEALSSCLDSGLAFEYGWNLSNKDMDPISVEIETELRKLTPWVNEGLTLNLFANTNEYDELMGVIFKTSDAFGANTVFAIWNLKNKVLVHVSLPGTLKEILLSYRSYYASGFWKNVYSYHKGLAWWYDEGDVFSDKYLGAAEAALRVSRNGLGNCTVSRLGLLPNPVNVDYESTQNMCVIFKDSHEKHFSALLKLQTTDGADPKVSVADVIFDTPDPSYAGASLAAYEMVKERYAYLFAWIRGAPDGCNKSLIESPLLSTSNISDLQIIFYFKNIDTLLVITKSTCGDISRACFIALRKITNQYQVTWVGKFHDMLYESDTEDVKFEAELYHQKATFSYQENWETPETTEVHGVELEQRSLEGKVKEFCFWNVSSSHKIKIFGRTTDGNLKEFWYVPFVLPERSPAHVQCLAGPAFPCIIDVLEELGRNIDNPLLFSQVFYKECIKSVKGINVPDIVTSVDTKYSKTAKFVFETMIIPTDFPTKAIVVLNHQDNQQNSSHGLNEPYVRSNKGSDEVHILVPMVTSNGKWHRVESRFDRGNNIIKITGDWRDYAGIYLRVPFTFTSETEWKNGDIFPEDSVELILENAPWKANVSEVYIGQSDTLPSGTSVNICYLDKNDLNSRFLVVWDSQITNLGHRCRYVGPMGNLRYVQQDYFRYITSQTAFGETRFALGIAWFDNKNPLHKIQNSIYDFLKREYLKSAENATEAGNLNFWERCKLGRITVRFDGDADDVVTYCLVGNINPTNKESSFKSILIKVKETILGIKCLGFQNEKTQYLSAFQAENDPLECVAMHRPPWKTKNTPTV